MVSNNLKKIRIAKGIKQSHLASELGISSMSYSRLERGESKLDVDRLQVIAKVLEVPISDFFIESNNNNYLKMDKEEKVT